MTSFLMPLESPVRLLRMRAIEDLRRRMWHFHGHELGIDSFTRPRPLGSRIDLQHWHTAWKAVGVLPDRRLLVAMPLMERMRLLLMLEMLRCTQGLTWVCTPACLFALLSIRLDVTPRFPVLLSGRLPLRQRPP